MFLETIPGSDRIYWNFKECQVDLMVACKINFEFMQRAYYMFHRMPVVVVRVMYGFFPFGFVVRLHVPSQMYSLIGPSVSSLASRFLLSQARLFSIVDPPLHHQTILLSKGCMILSLSRFPLLSDRITGV